MTSLFLDKLKESPKDETLNFLIVASSIPFIFLTILFCVNEVFLEMSTGYGVLDFELARTQIMIWRIFSAWGSSGIRNQVVIHQIDNVFAIVYALFASLCILKLSRESKGRVLRFGLIIFLLPILAGICDIVENLSLLTTLDHYLRFTSVYPGFAFIFAMFKITFIITAICLFYAVSLLLIFRKYKIKIAYYHLTLIISAILIVVLCAFWNLLFSFLLGPVCIIMITYISYLVKKDSEI